MIIRIVPKAMLSLLTFVVTFLLICFAPASQAGVSTVFGPEDFVRSIGKPVSEIRNFVVQEPNDSCTLRIDNGGSSNQYTRVSSAEVILNKKPVVPPHDFNQQISVIEKPVKLIHDNELTVEVRSNPSSGFTLTITCLSDSDNTPPIADAGADQRILVGGTAQLDGSDSSDDDGNPLTYHWSLYSVPGGSDAKLSDALIYNPTLYIDLPGDYFASLVVNDGSENSPPSTVKISTENTAPTANAGLDQSVFVGTVVTLEGVASVDAEGDQLEYAWELKAKPLASTAFLLDATSINPQLDIDLPGLYTAELTVYDGEFYSAPDQVDISTENTLPVANAGTDQSVLVDNTVTLDGSDSMDVDGDPLSFHWSLITRPGSSITELATADNVISTFDVDAPGNYIAQLVVNDGTGDSPSDSVSISTENSPPVANAGFDQTVNTGTTVQLNGQASSDVDGDPLSYLWSLLSMPDGSNALLSDARVTAPTFDVDLPGSYVAQLTVRDGTVESAADTVKIDTVNSRPVADAGEDQTGLRFQLYTLNGNASFDDDDPLTPSWSLIAQPATGTAELFDTDTFQPTITPELPGAYVAQLIVDDGKLASTPNTITLNIENRAPLVDAGTDKTVFIGDPVSLDGSHSTDEDNDVLSFVWQILTRPSGSTALLTAGISDDKASLVPDRAGAYQLELAVNDSFDTSRKTIVVTADNRAPIIISEAIKAARTGNNYRYNVRAEDPDNDDQLTFSLLTQPLGMDIDAVTGSLNWQPGTNQAGSHQVSLQVVDRAGASDSQIFDIEVAASVFDNALPRITSAALTESILNEAYIYAVIANDPNGDTLSYQLTSRPQGMVIDAVTGRIDWTPDTKGDFPVIVSVTDTLGGQTSQSYILKARERNAAPKINSLPLTTATQGLLYQYTVEATDPNDDEITFTLSTAPVGMSIDAQTGIIEWLPSSTQIDTHAVIVEAVDPDGLKDTQDFSVGVSVNLNDKPVAHAGTDKKVIIGSIVALDGSGSFDPNGDALTYQWEFLSKPEGSVATLTGVSLTNPEFKADIFGKYVLQLVVNDTKEDSLPDTVIIIATNQVTTGNHHSCVLTKGGGVECWGSNQVGQLGLGVPTSELSIPFPVTVISDSTGAPLIGATLLSSGVRDHTCALMEAGSVKCWGWNFNGNLGDGTDINRFAAVDVLIEMDGAPLTGIMAIEVGGDHSCVITSEGGVKCWGWGNHGQLGNDNLISGGVGARSLSPLDVLVEQGGEPLHGVTAVSAGLLHTCAIMDDSSVKCWGGNTFGQLGNGTNLENLLRVNVFSPVDVLIEPNGAQLKGVIAIAAGSNHTCALMNNTGVKCWGINNYGQLGNGIFEQGLPTQDNGSISTTPVDVLVELEGLPLKGVIAISAGETHTCALMEDSGIKCWGGLNESGELGIGSQSLGMHHIPANVLLELGGAPLTGVSGIAAGYRHTCATMENGGVKCWGEGDIGQLGNGEKLVIENGVVVFNPAPQLSPVDTLLGQDAVLVAISLSPVEATLLPGDTQQYNAIGIMSDGSTENHTGTALWESTDPTIATVDVDGKVTAVNYGVTRIRVNYQGITGIARLVVAPGRLMAIEVNPKNANVLSIQGRDSTGCVITAPSPCKPLDLSLTEQGYSATGIYADGTRLDLTSIVTWVSNTSAATITTDGLAVGVGLGESTISASQGGVTGSGLLTVHEVVDTDDTPPIVSLSPDDNTQLTGLADILVAVNDDNLLKYELAIAEPHEVALQVLSTGSSPINGVVTTIDSSSLQNGLYNVSLTAVDRGGNTSSIIRVYQVQDEAKVGLLQLAFIDLSVPVSGVPIEIIRSYDNRVKSKEDFGIGWRLSVRRGAFKSNRIPGEGWQILTGGGTIGLPCQFVSETAFHSTEVRLSDVEYYRFRPTISGSAAISGGCTADVGFTFIDGSTPGATLEILDGTGIFYENNTNRVLKIGSVDEVFDPKKVRLTTADGRIIEMDQLSGGVTRIEDINGNALNISETGITHTSGKSITFTRDTQGRITKITDPMGNELNYAYDAVGDLVSFTDQATNQTTFSYDAKHNLTEIVNPLGNRAIRTEFDSAGRLIATIDADGNRTELAHDIQNRHEAITDSLGRVTVHEYDEQGNVLTTIDALGNRTEYTYDANGNELTVTDALGNVTTNTYDASNNLLTETDPLGNISTHTYTTRNEIKSTQDALGNITTYIYPITSGNLEGITDPLGNTTSFGFDRQGNLASLTEPLGNVTRYQYDGLGNRIQQIDPLGHVTHYVFDDNGNELSTTVQRTNADGNVVTQTTVKEYDALNRVIKITDPLGNTSQTEYNAAGKVITQIDENGRRTQFDYDIRGNQIRTLYPDGKEETIRYDTEGNQLESTNRAGQTTSYAYDALNRLVKTTLPDGSNSRTVYDKAGQEVAVFDPNGNESNTQYDVAGNIISLVDVLGNKTQFSFDAAGRQTLITDASGNSTTTEYDAAGRRIKTILPDGTNTQLIYDDAGRVMQKIDQAGNTSTYVYNAQGQLEAVVDALGQQTHYSYDEQSNQIAQTDANNNTTRYEYDMLGRRIATVLPLGQRSESSYDAVGNQTSTTDFNGNTISFVYDLNNRLTTKQLPDSTTTTYSYTANGQIKSVIGTRGTTSYTYDMLNRLDTRTDPGGESITYSYDAAGNRTSVTTASGDTNYTFDAINRIKTVTAPDGRVTSYTYNELGNLIRTDFPNGTVESRTFNTLHRLLKIENRQSMNDKVISSFNYTLDPTGNRIAVDEHNGRRVEYSYDNLYRLESENIFNTGVVDPVRATEYVYDIVGNRLIRDDSAQGITSYNYDNNDRLLDETIGSVITTYQYDDNGNTLSKTTDGTPVISYTWNFENRLEAADTDNNGVDDVAYQYDPNGIRVAKTVNGNETRYLIDANRPYAQVLEESNSAGDITAFYIHGLDLISQGRGGQERFYHVDGLGSTRVLTDGSGLVTDRYEFDAYGQTITRTGSTENTYQYAGEQRDSDVGLDYLRARYLDVGIGHFVNRDVFTGVKREPLTLHKYLYASANPITNIDPSGQFSLGSVTTGVGIIGTLTTFSSPIFAKNSTLLNLVLLALTYDPKTLLTKSPVKNAIRNALKDSNSDTANEIEQGGTILLTQDNKFKVKRWSPGKESSIKPIKSSTGFIGSDRIIASFHTHPSVGLDLGELLRNGSTTVSKPGPSNRDPKTFAENVNSTGLLHYVIDPNDIWVLRRNVSTGTVTPKSCPCLSSQFGKTNDFGLK